MVHVSQYKISVLLLIQCNICMISVCPKCVNEVEIWML